MGQAIAVGDFAPLVREGVGEVNAVLSRRHRSGQGKAGADGYYLAAAQVGLHRDIGGIRREGEAHEAEHSRAGSFQIGLQRPVGGVGEADEFGGSCRPLRHVEPGYDHHLTVNNHYSRIFRGLVDGDDLLTGQFSGGKRHAVEHAVVVYAQGVGPFRHL